MNIINTIIQAIIQILVLSAIPFLVYLIQKRTTKGFFNYVGLKKSTKKANLLAVLASFIFVIPPLLLAFANEEFRSIILSPGSITGQFSQMGYSIHVLLILLITAIFKTGFAEELLFRGFIAKRLIAKIGFAKGNTLQALLFGIIHVVLVATATNNLFFLAIIFLTTSLGPYVSVVLNEKYANGSIIPGWISHALANIISYSSGFLF